MAYYLHVASGVIDTNQPWSVRIYSSATASEATAETNWHAGFSAFFNTASVIALWPTSVSWTGTYTSTMDANFHQTTKTSTAVTATGTGTTALPPHNAMLVTWRSALATRYGRGRWYLPPFGTASLATGGNVLSATAVGDLVSALNAGLGTWVGVLGFQILHRRGTKGGITPLSLSPIIAGDVPNRFGVQRRRDDKAIETRSTLTF